MSSPPKPSYSVAGSIGTDDFTAHVMLDKKNHSVHVHFNGDMFDKSQKTILVKHAKTKFPEGENADVARQIVIDEFPDTQVQIKSVTAEIENPQEQNKPSQRTIIRFKK